MQALNGIYLYDLFCLFIGHVVFDDRFIEPEERIVLGSDRQALSQDECLLVGIRHRHLIELAVFHQFDHYESLRATMRLTCATTFDASFPSSKSEYDPPNNRNRDAFSVARHAQRSRSASSSAG